MLISTRGRYALRVLIDVAEHQGSGYLPLKEVAERQEISEKYLESIVKDLVRAGVLTGLRGKGGGYRLCCEPDQINVGDVLQYMEGSLAPVACLEMGGSPCSRAVQCRTLQFWHGLDETINRYTHGFTIADLMQKDESVGDYII